MIKKLYKQLYEQYDRYKEKSIENRLSRHQDIIQLLEPYKKENGFDLNTLGYSVEERSIKLLTWGKGKKNVLLWSQMHGDEPTATMAFFDVFNFLKSQNQFSEIRDTLFNNLTLHFIPLLNPDGAERYQRRNALQIDLNRDAVALQAPESKILNEYRIKIKPDWAFNMHDQRRYYTVGNTLDTATISFLAPSFNQERSVNETRSDAMQLIAFLHNILSEFIPRNIAKYTDKYYPRSFGDNFQKAGVRSILVESGGFKGDPEKQYIRKLHFLIIVAGLKAIADQSFKLGAIKTYWEIPENTEFLYDLIIRNVSLEKNGAEYIVDLAFKHEEITHEEHWDFYHQSSLVDLGDLSTHHGYEEFDATGFKVQLGKIHSSSIKTLDQLDSMDLKDLLLKGITDIRIEELPSHAPLLNLPVRLVPAHKQEEKEIKVDENPSLLLEKDGIFHYAIINGFLKKLNSK